jgi:ATP-binding protein involved in chromosome partitioning
MSTAVPDSPEHVPVIAIASGKGGVGKTTVAVNLALALTAQGHRTGLVDADLYGPDVPRMMGLRRRAEAGHVTLFARPGAAGSRLQMVSQHGVQLASAAFLLGENQGLGITGGIAQLLARRLLADTDWDGLDYLVMDLPPGTADVQQFVFALSGRPLYVLVVATPQVIAHQDARRLIAHLAPRRGAAAARIDVAGVENMNGQVCPGCGQTTPLFPSAPDEDSIWGLIPKLASIPFSYQAARDADDGRPVMVTGAVPEQVAAYQLIAEQVRERLADLRGPAGSGDGGETDVV